MSDIIEISKQIEAKIREIDKIRSQIKQRGEEKAQTASDYDKAMAMTLIGLENGKVYTLDGYTINDPPKSIMEKTARGICWQEKLEADKAEANYKSIISNLEAVKSQLNALQSLNKHLD
jgi:hypothetical protein